jgi:DNA-binding transcriptional LysR family regulator
MDLPDLRAFLAVADTGSFSRAAERLSLTQPAVSKRIADLERGLDTRLFDRTGRRVSLTEGGRALLPRARRLLADIEDTRRTIANLSGAVGGRLDMATSHHIGLHRLPGPLRRFTSQFPDAVLALQFMDSEAACNAVAQGEIELAVVTLPAAPAQVLETRTVWHDELVVVASDDHALAGRRRVAAADLVAYPAILPGPGTFTRAIIDTAFSALGVSPVVSMSTNYLETIRAMVGAGLGWSVLPETLLGRGLRLLPIQGFRAARALGTVRHRERTASSAAAAFVRLIDAPPAG